MAKPKKPTKSCSKAGSKLATDRDPAAASKLARCGKTPAKKKPARKRAPTKRECQAAAWSLTEIGSKKAGKTMSACAKKAAKRKGVSTGAKRDRRDNPAGDFRRDLEEFFRPRTGGIGRLVASKSRAMDSTGQEGLAWTLHDPRAAAAFYNASADARRLGEELAAVASRHGLRPYATDARSIRFYEVSGPGRRDNPSRVWLFDAGPTAMPRYTMIDTDVSRVDGERQRLVVQWTVGTERSVQSSAFRNHLSESQWNGLGDFSSLGSRIRVADIGDRQSRSFAEDVLRAWSAKPSDAALPSGFRGELETLLRSRLGSFGQYRDVATRARQHDVAPTVEVILEDQALGRAILREDGVEQEVEALARKHGLRYEQSSAHVHLFHRDGGRRSNPGGLMSAPSKAAYDRALYALRVEHLRDRREVADVARAVYGDSPGVFGADDDGTRMEFRFDTVADLRRGYELVTEDVRRHNRQVSWSAREIRSGRSLLAPLAGRAPWPGNLR